MLNSFAIILVRPQLSNNIGAVARIMHNFSCSDLRLVNPRAGWHDENSNAIATGAAHLLDKATVHASLNDAVADLNLLFALTARTRYINKPLLDVKNITHALVNCENDKVGLIFGPENSGLSNEDIVMAHKLFNISTNPECSSLNLSHAVAVTLHQLYNRVISPASNSKISSKATRIELINFLDQFEHAIEQTNFIQVDNKKASMLRNIKNIFTRIEDLTSQEISTLRGIITALSNK